MSRSVTPVLNPQGEKDAWKVAITINSILKGKTNNVGDVTLRASQTTTVITDASIGPQSHINFTPLTLSARTALNGLYVSSRTQGKATITHPSNVATDQNFTYSVTA